MLRQFLGAFAGLTMGAAVCAVTPISAGAQADEPRIAFVAGNSTYAHGSLKTALNDAGLVAEALRSVGFEIVESANAGQGEFLRRYDDFLTKLAAAGPQAVAFVYLSGHGLAVDGENYLLPADARFEKGTDVPVRAVALSGLMQPLADMPLRARVMVVDAARPLGPKAQAQRLVPGLDAVAAPAGMLVAFSSAPGTIAEDRAENYGPYATAIMEMVRAPRRTLDGIFMRVRARTHLATHGRQTPWHISAISDPVILVPADAHPGGTAQRPRRGSRPMREVGPDEAYAVAIEADTLEGYAEFVEAYPRHFYVGRVYAMMGTRREALSWLRARQIASAEAYWTYLLRYPAGMHAHAAERKLRGIGAANSPPPDFAAIEFEDVPPALPGEPARQTALADDGPPPPDLLIAPLPAHLARLPAPPPVRPRSRQLPAPGAIPPVTQFAPAGVEQLR